MKISNFFLFFVSKVNIDAILQVSGGSHLHTKVRDCRKIFAFHLHVINEYIVSITVLISTLLLQCNGN